MHAKMKEYAGVRLKLHTVLLSELGGWHQIYLPATFIHI